MKRELENGTTLIVDRYSFSGVAFSAAKYYNEKCFLDKLEWFKAPEGGLLKPDCVLFMRLPVEEAEGREEFGDERYEHRTFQQTVLQVFEQHLMSSDYWRTIDARGTIEEVQERVLHQVLDTIEECKHKPLDTLW